MSHAAATRVCSQCNVDLPRINFSGSQWKKGRESRCLACVNGPPAAPVVEVPAPVVEVPPPPQPPPLGDAAGENVVVPPVAPPPPPVVAQSPFQTMGFDEFSECVSRTLRQIQSSCTRV